MGHRANPEPAPRPQPGTPHLHAGGPRPRRVSRQKAGPAARRGARIHAETSCRAPNPHPTGRQCPCPVGHASTATPHRPPRLCRDRHYPPGRISWPPLRPVFYASDAPVKAASRRHRPRLGALPSTVACVSRVAFTGRATCVNAYAFAGIFCAHGAHRNVRRAFCLSVQEAVLA